MFPNEEFLQRAPDPNEVILDVPQENNGIEMNEPNYEMIVPVLNHEQNDHIYSTITSISVLLE
jgi:hypothetical protein